MSHVFLYVSTNSTVCRFQIKILYFVLYFVKNKRLGFKVNSRFCKIRRDASRYEPYRSISQVRVIGSSWLSQLLVIQLIRVLYPVPIAQPGLPHRSILGAWFCGWKTRHASMDSWPFGKKLLNVTNKWSLKRRSLVNDYVKYNNCPENVVFHWGLASHHRSDYRHHAPATLILILESVILLTNKNSMYYHRLHT